MSFFRVVPVVLTSITLIAQFGCKDREISSYRVRKEATPQAPAGEPAANTSAVGTADAMPPMASTPVNTAQGEGLRWTAPSHWTSKPASAMRRATYVIPGKGGANGELAVTAFPGNVGGNLANVNRWRGQIGLPPITDADLGTALAHYDVDRLHIDVVDIKAVTGDDPQRVIGAIVPFGESTWFFKFSGPDSLLTAENPVILDFIKSIKTP